MKKVKTTNSGIKVTLDDKDVTVRYSKSCISMFSFKTKQKAKEFISNFRQGRNVL